MNALGRLALMLALALPLRLAAQISPGPLARAHASLEGASNCVSCHGVRREPMARLCVNCHKEIKWLIDRERGFHARVAKQTKMECASCHPDHAGTGFQMIEWEGSGPAKFDHLKAGWALEGKHKDEKCEGCHTARYRTSLAAELSPRKASAGWVGLETGCVSCHRDDDAHNGKLNVACGSCHDSDAWNTALRFDHQKSDYPLTGKHTDVECEACHLVKRLGLRTNEDGAPRPVFKPVPHRDCVSCHVDPHKGQLSGECSDCHVTRGFSIIDKREFNHSATRYPLRGKHASVSCDACHGKNLTSKKPAFATCTSCHTDPHKGEGTIAGKPQDCAACHRVESFAPSTFTVVRHRETVYALEGKHASVTCAACHRPTASGPRGTRVARLRMPFARCADCHADVHAGQLSARPNKGACESCHSVTGFAPSTFTLAQHASLKLPLEGRHAAITCGACHGAARPGLPPAGPVASLGAAKVALTLPAQCTTCHVDAHTGRFEAAGAVPLAGSCSACHTTTAFHPSAIDIARHDAFTFKLDGAHRAVACVQCHSTMRGNHASSTLLLNARNVPRRPFGEQRNTCGACHETPHGTQFATRKDQGECAACHSTDTFAPATRFDHNRQASFKLEGAHAKVACGACHTSGRDSRGAPVTTYRGTSAKCESCHGGRNSGRPT